MPSLPTSHSPENLPDSEIESLRHVVGLLLPLVRVSICLCMVCLRAYLCRSANQISGTVNVNRGGRAKKSCLAPAFHYLS